MRSLRRLNTGQPSQSSCRSFFMLRIREHPEHLNRQTSTTRLGAMVYSMPANTAPKEYRWLSLRRTQAAEPLAEALGVSEMARGPNGFLDEYKRAGTARAMKKRPVPGYPGQTWGQRRAAFIARTLAQYRKNPTERRRVAMEMWAYFPSPLQ